MHGNYVLQFSSSVETPVILPLLVGNSPCIILAASRVTTYFPVLSRLYVESQGMWLLCFIQHWWFHHLHTACSSCTEAQEILRIWWGSCWKPPKSLRAGANETHGKAWVAQAGEKKIKGTEEEEEVGLEDLQRCLTTQFHDPMENGVTKSFSQVLLLC